jgi:hypothetical protein
MKAASAEADLVATPRSSGSPNEAPMEAEALPGSPRRMTGH